MVVRKSASDCLVAVIITILGFGSSASAKTILKVAPERSNGAYSPGEKARFVIEATVAGKAISGAKLECIFSGHGGRVVHRQSLVTQTRANHCAVAADRPGIIQLEARLTVGGQTTRSRAAAVIGGSRIVVSHPPPKDFWSYWDTKVKQMKSVPLNAKVTPKKNLSDNDSHVFTVTLDGPGGAKIYGWLCRPARVRKMPALMLIPSAGVYAPDPYQFCGFQGMLVFKLNVHEIPVDASDAVYAKKGHGELAEYAHRNQNNVERYYFGRVFLSLVRSLDFLTQERMWDGRNLLVSGSSQGGGLSIVAAGLDKRVSAVAAQVPGLGDLRGALQGRQSGWPGIVRKGASRGEIRTASYFDAAYFAQRVRVPALLAVGLLDDVCAPTSVYSIFNALQSKRKQLIVEPARGHDGTPDWLDRQRAFLKSTVR